MTSDVTSIEPLLFLNGWDYEVDDECIMLFGDHTLCFADDQLVGYYRDIFRRANGIVIKEKYINVLFDGDCIERINKP